MNVLQSIVGGLVGSFAKSLLRARTGDQPPFAALLAREVALTQASPGAREIERVANNLLGLPVTTDEARAIAARLVALAQDLKDKAPCTAESIEAAIKGLVSEVSARFNLSGNDQARLAGVARNFIQEEISQRLPA